MQPAIVGTLVRLENVFDLAGVLTDPNDIVFTLKVPGEVVLVTYTWPTGGGEIVRDAVGIFHVDYVPSVAGTFIYSWNASGNMEVTNLGTLEVRSAALTSMRVPAYMTSADLDMRIGAAKVDQLFDDDGDGYRDPLTINTLLCEAEDFAAGYMRKSWPQEQIATLAGGDETFKGHVAWVAIEMASERRHEFIAEDGKGRYWAQYQRAKEHFDRLSRSQLTSPGEAAAGGNRQSGGALGPTVVPGRPSFIFAPDRGSPTGHGGFIVPLLLGLGEVVRAVMHFA